MMLLLSVLEVIIISLAPGGIDSKLIDSIVDGVEPSRAVKRLQKASQDPLIFQSKICGDNNVSDKMNIDTMWPYNSHIINEKEVLSNSIEHIDDESQKK